MTSPSSDNPHSTLTPLSQACFAVSTLAFIGSLACATINATLSGWMAVAGMAGLGLFYLALGVLNLGTSPKPSSQPATGSSKMGVTPPLKRIDSESEAETKELVEV